MKIAVCCKLTPDSEDISVSPDGTADLGRANWGVSSYDLQALQAAADLRTDGDDVVVFTVGGTNIASPKLFKELMSRGNSDRLVRVAEDTLADADAYTIAQILAAMVRREQPDLVLFGEGSSDRYARTMGSLVAASLHIPSVTAVDRIALEGEQVIVDRDMEDGVETVSVAMPCALSVTTTINTPALPNMKAVLSAGKKPCEDVTIADLGVEVAPALTLVASEVPLMPGRQCVKIEGTPDEAATQLVMKLRADQVL